MDMRYVGQEHVVTVDLPNEYFTTRDRAAIKNAFDQEHQRRYTTSAPQESVEIASLRATVTGVTAKPPFEKTATGDDRPSATALREKRPVYVSASDEFKEVPVFSRPALLAGNRVMGPAIIEEYASTTVLMPGDSLQVDEFGNLSIDVGETK
jgi:N-methylhydantoinase A